MDSPFENRNHVNVREERENSRPALAELSRNRPKPSRHPQTAAA